MIINRDKFNYLPPIYMQEEHWQALIALGTPKSLKAGAMLYEQSTLIDEITCVTKGSLKMMHFFDNGNEKLYELLSAPTVLGVESLWTEGESFYPSVIAATDISYMTIPRKAAEELIFGIPEMIVAMFGCVRNSMCISRIRSVCSAPMNLLQKTAFAVLFMREAERDAEGYVAVTHEELAQLIGISRANVTTALAELAEKGIISKKRGRIKILDKNKLMELLDNSF